MALESLLSCDYEPFSPMRGFKRGGFTQKFAPAATPHGPWPSPARNELWYQVRGIAAFEGRGDPSGNEPRCKMAAGREGLHTTAVRGMTIGTTHSSDRRPGVGQNLRAKSDEAVRYSPGHTFVLPFIRRID
jgi:hypothetical protein